MRRSITVKLLIFSFIVLLLSGCLTNPITGKIGPAWTIPVGAPLASNTVHLSDFVGDSFDTRDDLYYFSQETDFSINLAEYIKFDFEDEIGEDIDFDIPSPGFIEAEISLAELNMDLDDVDVFEQLTFRAGTLGITFPGNSDWEVVLLTIDEQNLLLGDNNLADIVLKKTSMIKISAFSDAATPVVPTKTHISFTETELTSFEGNLIPIKISATDLNFDFDLDLELPEAVEDMLSGLEWLDLSLFLKINNPTNLPLDLEQLQIKLETSDESSYLVFSDDNKTIDGTSTTYTFKPDRDQGSADPIIAAFRQVPKAVGLEGQIVVGSNQPVDIQLTDLEVVIGLDIATDITFNLDSVESIDVGPFEIEADESLADEIDKFIESAYLNVKVNNNFPLGANLDLQISDYEDDWENATRIPLGRMPKGEESTLVFAVEEPIIELVRNGGYSQVVVTLLGEGTQDYALKATDYLKFTVWVEVGVKINH